jgi:hypothetical protein
MASSPHIGRTGRCKDSKLGKKNGFEEFHPELLSFKEFYLVS